MRYASFCNYHVWKNEFLASRLWNRGKSYVLMFTIVLLFFFFKYDSLNGICVRYKKAFRIHEMQNNQSIDWSPIKVTLYHPWHRYIYIYIYIRRRVTRWNRRATKTYANSARTGWFRAKTKGWYRVRGLSARATPIKFSSVSASVPLFSSEAYFISRHTFSARAAPLWWWWCFFRCSWLCSTLLRVWL